ncbi:MAG: hypothetical protein NTV44_00120, partial [Firmicutes bacterium]|nr:hypothetical protein [Bacillota bacterium]
MLGLAMAAGLGLASGKAIESKAFLTDYYRVYVVNTQSWFDNTSLYIHYWGGASGTTWESCPAMTEAVSDYYSGLYYYDVPNDTTNFLVKQGTGGVADWKKTANFTIDLNKTQAYSIEPSVSGQPASIGSHTVLLSAAQFTGVLYHIDSCSGDHAEGYEANPQLNNLFVNNIGSSEKALFPTTMVTDYVSENLSHDLGKTATVSITNKLAMLQAKYDAAHPAPGTVNIASVIDDKS